MSMCPILAASEDSIMGFVIVIVVVVAALVIWLVYGTLYKVLKRVPPRFRRMTPGHVFLAIIPLFGLVWVFIIVSRITESLQGYIRSTGQRRVDDCGKGVGQAWAILSVCGIIPVLGGLASIAALVCMIIYVMKVNDLSKRISHFDPEAVEVFE